jgi:hypothetical protein
MASVDYQIPALGGLNKAVPPNLLQRHYSPNCTGVWNRDGRVVRMPGLVDINTDSPAGSGAIRFMELVQQDNAFLVVAKGNYQHQYSKTTRTFTDISCSQPMSVVCHEQFFDSYGQSVLFISNASDLAFWTGSGIFSDPLSETPSAVILCSYEGYLLAVQSHNRRRIQYSALNNGTSWPVDNYFEVRRSGSYVKAMVRHGDRCAIYKPDSISMLDFVGGGLVFDLTEDFVKGPGVVSQDAVVPVGDRGTRHFFISGDANAYMFDGIDCQPIGDNIRSILANMSSYSLEDISGGYLPAERKVVWSYGPNLLAYDIRDNSWWINSSTQLTSISSLGRQRSNEPESQKDMYATDGSSLMRFLDENEATASAKILDLTNRFWTPFDNLNGQDDRLKVLTNIVIETNNLGSGSIRIMVHVNNNKNTPAQLVESESETPQEEDFYIDIDLSGENSLDEYIVHELDVCVEGFNFAIHIWGRDHEESVFIPWEARITKLKYEDIGEYVALPAEDASGGTPQTSAEWEGEGWEGAGWE